MHASAAEREPEHPVAGRPAGTRAPSSEAASPLDPRALLRLQATAGNAAVSGYLQRLARGRPVSRASTRALQRCGQCGQEQGERKCKCDGGAEGCACGGHDHSPEHEGGREAPAEQTAPVLAPESGEQELHADVQAELAESHAAVQSPGRVLQRVAGGGGSAGVMAGVESAFAALKQPANPGRSIVADARSGASTLHSHPVKTVLSGVGASAAAAKSALPNHVGIAAGSVPRFSSSSPSALGAPPAPKLPAAALGPPPIGGPKAGAAAPGAGGQPMEQAEARSGAGDADAGWENEPVPQPPMPAPPPTGTAELAQVHGQLGSDPHLPAVGQAAGVGELPTTVEGERASLPFTGESVRGELSALLHGAQAPPVDAAALRGGAGGSDALDTRAVVRQQVEEAAAALRVQGVALLSGRRDELKVHKSRREAELRGHLQARAGHAQSSGAAAQAAAQTEAAAKQAEANATGETQKAQAETHSATQIEQAQSQGQSTAASISEQANREIETTGADAQGRADETVAAGQRQAEDAEAQARSRSSTGIGLVDRALDAARSFVNDMLARARRFVADALAGARRILASFKAWAARKLAEARAALAALGRRIAALARSFVAWLGRTLRSIGAWLGRTLRAIGAWLKKAFWAIVKFLHSVLAWIVMAIVAVVLYLAIAALGVLWLISWLIPWWGKAIRAWALTQIKALSGLVDRIVNLLGDPFTKSMDACDPAKVAALTPSVPAATARASAAAGKLTTAATLDVRTQGAFTSAFMPRGGTITDAMVGKARGVLAATAAGIPTAPVDFRCDDASEPACAGVVAYTFHQKLAPFVSIHVCPVAFTRGTADLEDTVLHEGTHKYASTDDNSASTTDEALDDAAAYERFARTAV